MAIKTFTTGEVLTAADTNTYLANSGLVYVTSTTFSGSASVSLNNCFTSTYTSYRVVLTLTGSTAGGFANFRVRASGSDLTGANYYRYGYTAAFSGAFSSYNAGGQSAFVTVGQWGGGLISTCYMDISEPMTANRTNWIANVNDTGGGSSYNLNGLVDVTTAYDGFTVYQNGGGTITGTITVYGYRKA